MTATTPSARVAKRVGPGARAMLALLAAALTAGAQAANTLRDIQFSPDASGGVQITLQLDGPASDAQVFTTDDPPRIAVDLPETVNGVADRRIAVGSGATSSITAVEANGRTRVVVDLFRAASFESRAEGNQFILTVTGSSESVAEAMATAAAETDPLKQVAGAEHALTNVDFRRADNGGGRIIVGLSAENIGTDYEDTGEGIQVAFNGARLPESLSQRIDVTDFATPVQFIEVREGRNGARISIKTDGKYEAMAYQSGTDYVVDVTPKAEAAGDETELAIPGEEEAYTGTPVTFNFQNIPVRTVLQLIAEESGLNVVAADTVSGNVTLRLINVPWDQALDIVLRAKGLDKRRDGNVVWIAPQAELAAYEQARADARLALEQRAELQTAFIPINYGNAEDIAKLLTDESKRSASGAGGAAGQAASGFLSPRGSVTFDRRTNTLLLNDNEEKIREIKALIAMLDRTVDQVLIEARIVVASESFARELGAKFGISAGYEDRNGNIFSTSGNITSTDQMTNVAMLNRFAGRGSGLPVAAPSPELGSGVNVPGIGDRLNVNLPATRQGAGSIGFAILGADYLLDLELSALEVEGRGEVISSPRVITSNQTPATVKQGSEVPYSTTTIVDGVTQSTVAFKDVTLELTATPTITQDGRVALTLLVKKDDIGGLAPNNEFIVDRREVSTSVLMENAQTVVIGGVYEFSSREDLSKVPFLGDVPVLGNLFKRKGRSTDKAELLIFVTPRVLAVGKSGR